MAGSAGGEAVRVERDELARFAERVVDAVRSPDLRMGLIAGSVARGVADDRSDLDVYLYWERVDVAFVAAPARFAPLDATPVFGVPTETGWFSKLRHGDRYVDVESVDAVVLGRAAEALAGGMAPAGWVVKLAAGLRDAIAVFGHDELVAWQRRLVYRDDVATAEAVARTPRLLAPSALYELTYARGDALSFAARLSQLLLDVVALLGAVNRRFIPVEDPKWLPWHLDRLTAVPAGFDRRVRAALDGPSPATMADLDTIVAETLDLVDGHVPDVDTRTARYAITLRPRPPRRPA